MLPLPPKGRTHDMNAIPAFSLPDVQRFADTRKLALTRVGVTRVTTPLRVRSRDGSLQSTAANVDLFVSLPAHLKGTHMSRFLEVLEESAEPIDCRSLAALFGAMLRRLDAGSGEIRLRFPYFMVKRAPVSGVPSHMDYRVHMKVRGERDGACQVTLEVRVPVTSLCPCSKEISKYGAHNQRSEVRIAVVLSEPMAIEELIQIAESAASCELYGILKRPDEKFVTERAYDNPKFVEDLVRDVALQLNEDARVRSYRVAAENFESIHNHSAYAQIECKSPPHSLDRARPRHAHRSDVLEPSLDRDG